VNQIDITVSHPHPPSVLKNLKNFCQRVLNLRGKHNWELSVLCTDDVTIRDLNEKYRGIDKETDVLSFSQLEGQDLPSHNEGENIAAGDIVISVDTLIKNAQMNGIPFQEELMRVLIHAILHLEGLDHNEEGAEDAMLALQEALLEKLRKEKVF
jgi:probable rRNA maturation factor